MNIQVFSKIGVAAFSKNICHNISNFTCSLELLTASDNSSSRSHTRIIKGSAGSILFLWNTCSQQLPLEGLHFGIQLLSYEKPKSLRRTTCNSSSQAPSHPRSASRCFQTSVIRVTSLSPLFRFS